MALQPRSAKVAKRTARKGELFQTKSYGLASASTACEEAMALPARIKPHDSATVCLALVGRPMEAPLSQIFPTGILSPRVEKSATGCPSPLRFGTAGATAKLRRAWRHKRAFDSMARQLCDIWACNEGAPDGVLQRKYQQNGSPFGRATSSGENYRAQGMGRRSSLHTRPPGLASASTSYEETVAFLARNKPHDRCYNVVDASAENRRTRS